MNKKNCLFKMDHINNDHDNRYQGTAVTDTLTNGFFSVDKNWRVQYWNKAAEKILNVQSKNIIGKNLWETFASIIPIEFYAVYQKAFRQNMPVHFEEYWAEMGGWFDVIIYHCDDTLSVSFKNSNDVHAEDPENSVQQLKKLKDLYKFVTEISNDCLWEWNIENEEIFWIDGGHKRVFGYQVENALIPQSFWESCIHPDDKKRVMTKLLETFNEASGSLWEDNYRFKNATGSYAYVHDRAHIVYNANKKAIRMIGATQDVTQKVLLENKAEHERTIKHREITDAILTAQENEREHIGKELHDNLNQVLGAAKLYIEMAKKHDFQEAMCLDKASNHIMHVMEKIRKLSKIMVTPEFSRLTLPDRIRILIDDFTIVNYVIVAFNDNDISDKDLDGKLQLNILRMVQEQLNNISKHAAATHVDIELNRRRNSINLLISDNGRGCDIDEKSKGTGISNIRSRAELYNGSVTIMSVQSQGYTLKVVLHLAEATR